MTVLGVENGRVRIEIDAPDGVKVRRGEVAKDKGNGDFMPTDEELKNL